MTAYLDARAMLASGADPLGAALRLAATVPPDGRMIVDAPFDPLPMRNLLASQGFSSSVGPAPTGGIRVSFVQDGLSKVEPADASVEACQGVPRWEEEGRINVDVRGLAPPLPMIVILRLLREVDPDAQVVVHHDRDPIYLYPELAEIGWRAELIDNQPGLVRLLLERAP